jgi:hypothetical protein
MSVKYIHNGRETNPANICIILLNHSLSIPGIRRRSACVDLGGECTSRFLLFLTGV